MDAGDVVRPTIAQPYHEADPFKPILTGTPPAVENKFHWANHLIDTGNVTTKFDAFAASSKFPVESRKLVDSCLASFADCRRIYETVLFPPGAPRLPYHDINHALITSVTAQKIFLGGLVNESQKGKITLPAADKLAKLHTLMAYVGSFHEIDDWWNRPYPPSSSDTAQNPHIEEAKASITKCLTDLGLSSRDFNMLLVLDDFRESQEACLAKSLSLKDGEGFLPANDRPSLLDQFSPSDKEKILTIASKALCAADFLQVINPAYIQDVKLDLGDGRTIDTFAGPAVLAMEMAKWRRKALEPARFGKPDGSINWQNVNLSLGFFQNVALPRINSGLEYLGVFTKQEYDNASVVLANKHSYLLQKTPVQ